MNDKEKEIDDLAEGIGMFEAIFSVLVVVGGFIVFPIITGFICWRFL
ncbi:MAG: hypothetical protein ACXAEU_23835 [Candidatus Hodarchaeales archaeon]|jgi:hypothetical protein